MGRGTNIGLKNVTKYAEYFFPEMVSILKYGQKQPAAHITVIPIQYSIAQDSSHSYYWTHNLHSHQKIFTGSCYN